mmetsp:Transcript_22634/g.63110  ORF Transcript_22634/g.63110 Transcript_22634/m.63110 type:complete len:248 (-) Transcript_22634:573-1316(-)
MPRASRHAMSPVACHSMSGTYLTNGRSVASSHNRVNACAVKNATAICGAGSSAQCRDKPSAATSTAPRRAAAKAMAQFAASATPRCARQEATTSASSAQKRSCKEGEASSDTSPTGKGHISAKATASIDSCAELSSPRPTVSACSAKVVVSSGCRRCCWTRAMACEMTQRLCGVIVSPNLGSSATMQSKTPAASPPKPKRAYAWSTLATAWRVQVREQTRRRAATVSKRRSLRTTSRACALATTLKA